jgi:uncharacterized protein YhaN
MSVPSPRHYHHEITAIEDALAVLSEHLELLAALARHCTTDRARRRLAERIAAAERRAMELRARRRAVQEEIARNGGATR